MVSEKQTKPVVGKCPTTGVVRRWGVTGNGLKQPALRSPFYEGRHFKTSNYELGSKIAKVYITLR